jgi:hypothetical protein
VLVFVVLGYNRYYEIKGAQAHKQEPATAGKTEQRNRSQK